MRKIKEHFLPRLARGTHFCLVSEKFEKKTCSLHCCVVAFVPSLAQVLTVSFIAGSIIEGHSNGIAASLPACHGSPADCGCPAVCPNLTETERFGSGNVVNVRVATGTPVCNGDCQNNTVNRLAAPIGH